MATVATLSNYTSRWLAVSLSCSLRANIRSWTLKAISVIRSGHRHLHWGARGSTYTPAHRVNVHMHIKSYPSHYTYL